MRASAAGWDGSANAASSPSSTVCSRGAEDTSFTVRHGDLSAVTSVRYVITLDSDTHLPMDTARRLVGHAVASAEPSAVRRPAATRHRRIRSPAATCRREPREREPDTVRAGLLRDMSALIRIRARFPTSIRICFTRAASSARASTTSMRSPQALDERVPENTLLSHDLFEGLSTPVPDSARISTSSTTTRRTTWRLPHGCTGGYEATGRSFAGCGEPSRTRAARPVPNTLPAISRWKILDNLRRSLLPSCARRAVRGGLDGAPGRGPGVVGRGVHGARVSDLHPGRPVALESRPGVPLREHVLAERDTLDHQRDGRRCSRRCSCSIRAG